MPIIETIVGVALGILGNYAATATQPPILNPWQRRLEEKLADKAALRQALASRRSFREQVRDVCGELSQDRALIGDLNEREREIWRLLRDPRFQDDFADWLMAGAIEEGREIQARLEGRMEGALVRAGATHQQIDAFKAEYFGMLDRAIFSDPTLAHWRHQLSLDYLREQVAKILHAAEQAAGIYSPERRQAALERYAGEALNAWDIVDLSNLPEGDIQIATQKLLLRQLYMPLRVTVEISRERAADETAFATLEQGRTARRLREAGRRQDSEAAPSEQRERVPVGARLGAAGRLVVLGDPGGGKTTLLRWIATAYLLRERDEHAYRQLPDIETLPNRRWLAVLIRCRDLGEADLCRSFVEFLTQHLLKSELLPDEADVMKAVILERIAAGEVLLLVDGLDEITNPQVRVQFCQELERTAARYPDTAIIVTSRIVGYRDMPYRMGAGFEHGLIAELSREDQDLFARRWVAVTEQHQPTAERERRAQDLIAALHSNDRIERLTGNPMLQTTLALVKRKVGKLPSRRNKLYAEAVGVLLNWNPARYQTIEEEEAIPQLAYLAYEMCLRGVQRLTNDEVLDLLDRIRREYPNVRAIRRRDSQEFLTLLEARSSILINSGGQWLRQQNREQAVWEFRHLTFQEYLAARALLDERYPGRTRAKKLAKVVGSLAGVLKESPPNVRGETELEVTDSWQEALRLLVADCKDDDVDEVLLAIATPPKGKDAARSARPRAVLAARCLADEPNVSEEVAQEILTKFATHVTKNDGRGADFRTGVDNAAAELGRSIWAEMLKSCLMREFFQQSSEEQVNCGGLWGMVAVFYAPTDPKLFAAWFSALSEQLRSEDMGEVAAGAFAITVAAYKNRAIEVPGMVSALLELLRRDEPLRSSAAWALGWLCQETKLKEEEEAIYVWQPQEKEVQILIAALQPAQAVRTDTVRLIATILGRSRNTLATKPLLARLDDPKIQVRLAVIATLGKLGDSRAVEPLIARLDDPEITVRATVAGALNQLGNARGRTVLNDLLLSANAEERRMAVKALAAGRDETARRLLSRHLNALDPWLDSQELITASRVVAASGRLNITLKEVRAHYEALAAELPLRLEWREEGG